MKKLQELKAKRVAALEAAKAIADKAMAEGKDMTEEQAGQVDTLLASAETLAVEIKQAEKVEERSARLSAGLDSLHVATPRSQLPTPGADFGAVSPEPFIPANVIRGGKLVAFAGESRAQAELKAFRFGMWTLAACGNRRAQAFCINSGLPVAAVTNKGELAIATEGDNATGGYLVPAEFDADLVRLVESYGVIRANARNVPMIRETMSRPRRTGGLTAYFVGENTAGTESTIAMDRINLTLKKVMALTTMSSELSEDSAISIGDLLMKEIATAFAYLEDNCGFNGDGTSPYGSITGLVSKITAATAGLATAASGSATDWSKITLAKMNEMVGLLPRYAATPKWYCSHGFWGACMQYLVAAAGGNTSANIVNDKPQLVFQGYQVEVVQVMPKSATAATIACMFGDLSMAVDFGAGRGVTIKFSEDATVGSTNMFESDDIAVKGTERFDINVHDVGDTTNPGPVVGLLTAS